MQRRDFLHSSALAFGSLTLLQQQWLTALFQDPWKISMLRRDTGIFTERGGTIAFLLSKKGIVVVDSQFPDQAQHLIGALKQKSAQPFELLINTHHHPDHSGGNIAFKDLAKHVLAHVNSKTNQQNQAKARNNEAAQWYPDLTYSDTSCQEVGKENICLHYFGPGHTNGDSLVHFEHANIVHMGDLLFNKIYPNIDRPAGASIENWILVLDKAYNVFDKKTIFICGHGQKSDEVTTDREFLKQQKFYLENLLDFVGKEIKAGKTKEEILQHTVIPGVDDWKDPNKFIKVNLTVAYEELTAEKAF